MTLNEFSDKFPDQINYLYEFSRGCGLGFECSNTLEFNIRNREHMEDHEAWVEVYDALYEWDI